MKILGFNFSFGKKQLTHKLPMKRSYDAAAFDRLTADFLAPLTSPDAEMRMTLVNLRSRSRELARNNDYIKNALRIIRNNVVGQGIGFQAQVKKQRGSKLDDAMNELIESAWCEWTKADSCDVAGKYSFEDMQSVLMTTIPKNGEAFIRIHRQKFGKSKVPLALEVLSADMVDETYNVQAKDTGNEIRMGVERDVYGRPLAYWFHDKPPGDWSATSTYSVGRRIRVPARDVIHLFVPEDEQQTRSVPWFVSSMLKLHHMKGFLDATVIGHRARSSVNGFY